MARTLFCFLCGLLLAALIINSTSVTWASGAGAPAGRAQLAETANWPMLAANPQRTSWTPEEVRGNLKVEWYRPIEPYIPDKIQPIAADGKIFVSTARGLYAINAASGDLEWVHATELPLGNSPTIAAVNGGLVAYVGGYDHRIHAINATTGQALAGYTAYEANAGFETNPLVIKDSFTDSIPQNSLKHPVIFAGNRDGYFYALDAVTGGLLWKYATGDPAARVPPQPILYSAAYKDGRIYFAAQDAYAYALSTNGTLVWRQGKFQGQGFHTYWPVLYADRASGRDYVIFTSAENYRHSEFSLTADGAETEYFNAHNPDGLLPTGNSPGPWPSGTMTIDVRTITDYYETYPYRHFVFVLDRETGQEYTFDSDQDGKKEYAPFAWCGVTHSGSKYPPVINGLDGIYYQQTPLFMGGWTLRGNIVGWDFGTHTVSRVSELGVEGFTYACDEPTAFSSGGKVIYSTLVPDNEGGAFDVSIPFGQAGRSWLYWGYGGLGAIAPNYDQMYHVETAWGKYVYGSQNGIYSRSGSASSPLIPYQGKVYFLKVNALIAFSPSGGQRLLPLLPASKVQSAPTPPAKSDLTQGLEAQIQAMLSAGHLRPGYHAAGFIDLYGVGGHTDEQGLGEIFDYFSNPSDTVVTLLQALPFLSPTLQEQVKTYLQANYGPNAPYDFTTIVHTGFGSGAQREAYITPPEETDPSNVRALGQPYRSPLQPTHRPVCGGDPATGYACGYWFWFPPYNFYAGWKYAQVFGGAKAIFDSMKEKIEAFPGTSDPRFPFLSKRPYLLHQYIAGYQGYLELQRLAYPSNPPSAEVQEWYDQALNLRLSTFSKDTPFDGHSPWNYSPGFDYNFTLSVARNFMFLTPELGETMSTTNLDPVRQAVDEYNAVAPYWFVSKFDHSYGEGTLEHLYDSPALFQAKAYILKEPYSELVKWLDVPAFERGDLFYIQNLVAALRAAPSGPGPSFADVPLSHAYYDEIEALYQAGYTAGCATNPLRYCPEQTMSRAESAVFVERGIHGATYDPPAPTNQMFADLALDSWAAKWVAGLWNDQYTAGCGTNPLVYCPWQGHTRAEGCVFYLRMMHGATYDPPQPTEPTFGDVPLDAWYAKWVEAAYAAGLIPACQTSDTMKFCPNDPLTRAMAAYMMVQAKGLR